MRRVAPILATAAGWWLGIEAVRAFFVAIVWNVAEDLPSTQLGLIGAAVWLIGLAGWIPARLLGPARSSLSLGVGVVALTVGRQAIQHEGGWAVLAVAAVIAWLWWLPAWLHAAIRAGSSHLVVPGLLLGSAAQVTGQLALDGLDLHALPGIPGALAAAGIGALLLWSTWQAGRQPSAVSSTDQQAATTVEGTATPEGAHTPRWGALAVLPWLFLQMTLLTNVGRLQSLGDWELWKAGILGAIALAMAAFLAAGWERVSGFRGHAALAVVAALLVAAIALGDLKVWLILPAQVALGLLLAAAFATPLASGLPSASGPPGTRATPRAPLPPRTWTATAIGGILFFILLFALYSDALDTLGGIVWPAGALIVALPGMLRRRPKIVVTDRAVKLAVPTAILALVAAGTAAGALPAGPEQPGSARAPARITVLGYNVHQGVARHGVPNLERTLDVIRGADADIVALQEVPRTWDLSGGIDAFAWLRAQLPGYHAVHAPTSVARFGNAIFSRYPITDSGFEWFPFGPSRDQRGFAWVEIRTDAGMLLVVTMHMTPYSRADEIEERTAQAGILLDFWAAHGKGPVVLAGDYNSEKSDPAYQRMVDGGLIDALAAAGAGDVPTFRSTGTPFLEPSVGQVDYVFVGPGIRVESGQVVDSDASDHLPLLVQVDLAGG